MQTKWILYRALVLITLLCAACSPSGGQIVPAVSLVLTANGQIITDYGTATMVSSSPLKLTALAVRNGQGTVEFFDGMISLGKLNITKDPRNLDNVNQASLEIQLTQANNGQRSYKVVFIGSTDDGQIQSPGYPSQVRVVTIQVP